MADGQWHSIELSMENYITFAVDNKTFVEEQCYNEFEYEDIDLFIGKCIAFFLVYCSQKEAGPSYLCNFTFFWVLNVACSATFKTQTLKFKKSKLNFTVSNWLIDFVDKL